MFTLPFRIVLTQAVLTVVCVYSSTNGTDPVPSSTEDTPSGVPVEEKYYKGKHDSFRTCSSIDLEPDEFEILRNGSAFVEVYNRTYESPFYIVIDGFMRICLPPEFSDGNDSDLASKYLDLLTKICIGISMVCLLLHLVVFFVVPDLQNLPGYNMASLCASLFLSYLLMTVSKTELVGENSSACIAAAVLTQFFFLASFLWMFVMAFDVFRSILHATGSLRVSSKVFKGKKYAYNSAIAWGISFVFTVAALIVDNVEGVMDSYRPQFEEGCWFRSHGSARVHL